MTATKFQRSTDSIFSFIGAALGVETPHQYQGFQQGFNSFQHADPSTLFRAINNCKTDFYPLVEC